MVALGATVASPASAAPKADESSKHYIEKGGPELLNGEKLKLGKLRDGEMHNFVYNPHTGETYFLGTGPVEEFSDETAAIFEDNGLTYNPTPEVNLKSVSPFGCSPSVTLCLYPNTSAQPVYAFLGPGTDSGAWYNINRVATARSYKARWYEVGSTAAHTLAAGINTPLMYTMNIRQVQQY